MHERRAWAAAGVAAWSWGIALWANDLGIGLVIGALALAAAIRGTPADPARIACFALGWQGLALSWFPDAWAASGGPGGAAATGLVVALSALPWLAGLGLASTAVRRGVPRGLAVGGGLAIGTALADWGLVPIVPADLAVAGPGLAWPAAFGGREVLALAVGALAGLAWERPLRASALAALWLAAGLLWQATPGAGRPVRVGIVETGEGALALRRPSGADARAERLLDALSPLDADLVVAPEGAWGRGIPRTPAPLVVGADRDGGNVLLAFAAGAEVDRFAKQLLVPGTEWQVFGLGRDRYQAGTGPRRLRLAGLNVLPLICYEDLFARASHTARTADLVVAASHDGWNRPAAWAHLAAARLVAVESGRWVVRPTTSGISAAIDPRGRLVWATAAIDADQLPGARAAVVTVHVPQGLGVPRLPAGLVGGLLLAALSSFRRTAG